MVPLDTLNDWLHMGITLPYSLYSRVKDESIATGLPWAELLRRALVFYLDTPRDCRVVSKDIEKGEKAE